MSSFFEPIAIIGQGCILPGALSPQQLWGAIESKRDILADAPDDYWGVPPQEVETTPDEAAMDRTWSTRGGYVRGFDEVFDSRGFLIDSELIDGLDPLFQWTLESARQAWQDAGFAIDTHAHARAGVILGNLSYPTRSLSDFAESVWRGESDGPDAMNRYMSGLPAHLIAKALGLDGDSFALDAACASSLYAIKLAIDRLHDRTAEVMLAGGVNHADDLFLHIGFCALNAMSRTGQSRPFHRDADGLIPAEGGGFVVLKRLEDAVRDGDAIAGVIRGIGLSNDGRGRGMLTPSEDGQWRAMQDAYAMSGLAPKDVSLVECHATGTPLGDATELRSMARVFEGHHDVPIGSLKSNMGHPITASGVAGLLKVLAAMQTRTRPATLHVEEPIEWLDDTPFRVLNEAEPWECEGLRRAAINNFGFGGNNAHLLVEEWVEQTIEAPASMRVTRPVEDPIAVVAMSVMTSESEDLDQFERAVLLHEDVAARCLDEVTFDVTELRFPPNDLKVTLPQQLVGLRAGLQIREAIDRLPAESSGIYMGMQCDTEIARYGARWRLGEDAEDAERDAVIDGLIAAGVVGTMPNIVANRLNSQFNLLGPSYTVSSEEASGVVALGLAARALKHGELDAALVGAVDLCCDPVHEAAAREVLPATRQTGGDAAVMLILKRLSDAQAAGDEVLALVDPDPTDASRASVRLDLDGTDAVSLTPEFGHAHAASGLLHVAAAVAMAHRRAVPPATARRRLAAPWLPVAGARHANVHIEALGEQAMDVVVRPHEEDIATKGILSEDAPRLLTFAASSPEALASAIDSGEVGTQGSWRAACVCTPADVQIRCRELAAAVRAGKTGEVADGCYVGRGDVDGEVAFVFTGPAGAYPGMGRELLLAMPGLVDPVAAQFGVIADAVGWIYDPEATRTRPPVDKLWGSSFMCQVHAHLTRDVLGITPSAAIGFCSGETNALFAMGAWEGLGQMHADIERDGVFDRELGGDLEALKRAWKAPEKAKLQWETYRVLARREEVEQALRGESRVHLTIVSGPNDMVIAGDPAGCTRVIKKLGDQRVRPLGYNVVMHCPEARAFHETWHALHHRPTKHVPGVRFYTNAGLTAYEADADKAADALTGQAMDTVDFPALIEKAWGDGVRVFIEHGPQSGCTRWIRKTLGDKPHMAVALDEYREGDVAHIGRAVASLWCAGIGCAPERWAGWISQEELTSAGEASTTHTLSFPAHLEPVQLAGRAQTSSREDRMATEQASTQTVHEPSEDGYQTMAPAPALPAVLGDTSALTARAPVLDAGAAARGGASPAPRRPSPSPDPSAPARPHPSPASAGDSASVSTAAPTPAASSQADPLSQVAARQFATFRQAHKEYLAQQTRMHQRYMQLRQQMTETMLEAMRGERSPSLEGRQLPTAPLTALSKEAVAADAAQRHVAIPTQNAGADAAASAPTSEDRAPTPQQKAAAPGPASQKETATNPAAAAPVKPAPTPEVLDAPEPSAEERRRSLRASVQGAALHTIIPSEDKPAPVGPTFDYGDIKIHASGNISEIFGPKFKEQDQWDVQVRMPEPPLLLCHRVTGIDAPVGEVSTGTLWCESDVPEDAWYLHAGRMPVGITIESGQADLMLISWMGADFANKGTRVYRLLGCELVFHEGGLPQPGDTLTYDIHVDGHARQNDIRLFFFHYDLEIDEKVRLSVRNGQAGFFTYDELADSKGILWTPEDEDHDAIAATPNAAHPNVTDKRSFSAEEVQRFAQGDVWEVFGEGFEWTAAHTATPGIQADRMRFMDEVTDFEPNGGPYGRGYLRAVQHISPDDWFFDGHFKNDPCMPGTLMFEGCVQTMAFYMAACGWTIHRDGYVFEPVMEELYKLRCRGQVSPASRELVYEVFVREVHDGPEPKIFADLLCTVDGLGAFHCERMGIQLTPAWPMDHRPQLLNDYVEPKPVATATDGFAFDYDSLLACAWGRPTRAFGSMYEPFDSHRRVARLPGPPYHFISRVADIDPEAQNAMNSDVLLTVEYDVPEDAWYFEENGARVMPYAVILEAGLQPCGWLASYVGCALTRDIDLAFRNLDGTSNQLIEVTPDTGTLQTQAHLKNIARAGGNIIVSFDVEMRAIDQPGQPVVMTMDTVFGFFPPESLAAQIGIATDDATRARLDVPAQDVVDLTQRPTRFCEGSLRLAEEMLLMIDRVDHWEAQGGEAGLGAARAVKDVDPNEWFFKAHFFQDPVQPGSLGLEALLQLLQWTMIAKNMGEGMETPRFEGIASDIPMTWKYRGQVVPTNSTISTTLEITETGEDDRGRWATAQGSLWVDGMRIYHATDIGMRIVEGHGEDTQMDSSGEHTGALEADGEDVAFDLDEAEHPEPRMERTFELDPSGEQRWLRDHRPTYTAPALPMMSILDLLAEQATLAKPGAQVVGLEDVEVKRWVIFEEDAPRRFRTEATPHPEDADRLTVTMSMWWEAPRAEMSRWEEVAHGDVVMGTTWPDDPEALDPLLEVRPIEDPYASGDLFHGPAFQLIDSMARDVDGARAVLDASKSGVPLGTINPALLDAALQAIPHDAIQEWWADHDGDAIAYPHAVRHVSFHQPTPGTGRQRVQVRFLGGEDRFVRFAIQIAHGDHIWASMELVEVLMPKGPLGRLSGEDRRAFIRDGQPVADASLSEHTDAGTVLTDEAIAQSNWFKGTIESVYDTGDVRGEELARVVAIKEHAARKWAMHPRHIDVDGTRVTAGQAAPLRLDVDVARQEDRTVVTDTAQTPLDLDRISAWWCHRLGLDGAWLGDDLYGAMLSRFVGGVRLTHPRELEELRGRSVLFLGNHEVQIESLLITLLASVMTDTTVVTLANAKHEQGWVGQLIRDVFSYPGCADPQNIVYFHKRDRASLLELVEGFKKDVRSRGASVMVHAPGTRAVRAGQPVEKVSSLFMDMALEMEMPIVPVFFDGGLPTEPLTEGKLEFPVGQTGQTYMFGEPILYETLASLDYAARRERVLDGINRLNPWRGGDEVPTPGVPRKELIEEVKALRHKLGGDEINATLLSVLLQLDNPNEDTRRLLAALSDSAVLSSLGEDKRAWFERMTARFEPTDDPRSKQGGDQ